MRRTTSFLGPLLIAALAPQLSGCDSCQARPASENLSPAQLSDALAKGIEASSSASAAPSAAIAPGAAGVTPSVGKPINQGAGPRRASSNELRGLPMGIVPGQGVGPIRFGATVETIERLMGLPCEVKSESRCQYVSRGLSFELEAGVLRTIEAFRRGRAALTAPDGVIVEYGFFNGELVPDLDFGMVPEAIQASYGKPLRVETIDPPGADGLAERHFYDGMSLEYDRWSNHKLVLGKLTVTQSATAAAARAAAAANRNGAPPPPSKARPGSVKSQREQNPR